MLYAIFEDHEGGCSCSPIEYKELQTILSKKGKAQDLDELRREYYNERNEINPNAYVKIRNFGTFSEWLIREKRFKEEEYKSISF
ncbi:MAG: hypothetical protein WC346_20715 [Methanogenium sp.]|jgi:hypothetical protein